jgi:hypothetical protein
VLGLFLLPECNSDLSFDCQIKIINRNPWRLSRYSGLNAMDLFDLGYFMGIFPAAGRPAAGCPAAWTADGRLRKTKTTNQIMRNARVVSPSTPQKTILASGVALLA